MKKLLQTISILLLPVLAFAQDPSFTLDSEWNSAAKINAATTDEDFLTESSLLELNPISVSADVNPAVIESVYYVDASGGPIVITIPDVVAGNDGRVIQIIMSTNGNEVDITTVGGIQEIGSNTSQTLVEVDKGITLQAVFADTKWHIVQDSRTSPSNAAITFYGLTEAGAVGGYARLAISTSDPDYSATPTDFAIGPVVTTLAIGGWVADQGTLIGLVSETVSNIHFKARRTTGSGTAYFYAEIYHRTSGGTETLLGTSGHSELISSAAYVSEDISIVQTEKIFASTDYYVVKFIAVKSGGGSSPSYEVELEGTTPARITLPVASSVVPHASLTGLLNNDHTQYVLITAIDSSAERTTLFTDLLDSSVTATGTTHAAGYDIVAVTTKISVSTGSDYAVAYPEFSTVGAGDKRWVWNYDSTDSITVFPEASDSFGPLSAGTGVELQPGEFLLIEVLSASASNYAISRNTPGISHHTVTATLTRNQMQNGHLNHIDSTATLTLLALDDFVDFAIEVSPTVTGTIDLQGTENFRMNGVEAANGEALETDGATYAMAVFTSFDSNTINASASGLTEETP